MRQHVCIVGTVPSTQWVFITLMVKSIGLELVWPGIKSWLSHFFISLFLYNPHLRICSLSFREREREREREKHRSVASHICPNWELNLQPRYVPWLGIEPTTFWCMGWHSNQPSNPARAQTFVHWPEPCFHFFEMSLMINRNYLIADKVKWEKWEKGLI